MKSPFPGMDPYIEACGHWEDFHTKLIGEIERTLAPLLPARYAISLAERNYVVTVGEDGKDENSFLPDVGVHLPEAAVRGASRGVAVAEPTVDNEAVPIRAFVAVPFREIFLEIYDFMEGRHLVTCLEVVSPSNKRRGTPGYELYQRKRQALLLGEANFVEIDLIREGKRLPMLDTWPKSPYAILVVRRRRAPNGHAWPAHFRQPLPAIPIPLAEPDADVLLPLQPLVDEVYRRSRFANQIDYSKPLAPALPDEDAAWWSAKRGSEVVAPARRRGRKR